MSDRINIGLDFAAHLFEVVAPAPAYHRAGKILVARARGAIRIRFSTGDATRELRASEALLDLALDVLNAGGSAVLDVSATFVRGVDGAYVMSWSESAVIDVRHAREVTRAELLDMATASEMAGRRP